MFQAIIFDFNGVLANDEPIHLAAVRTTARGRGTFGDGPCVLRTVPGSRRLALFRALYRDHNLDLNPRRLKRL